MILSTDVRLLSALAVTCAFVGSAFLLSKSARKKKIAILCFILMGIFLFFLKNRIAQGFEQAQMLQEVFRNG